MFFLSADRKNVFSLRRGRRGGGDGDGDGDGAGHSDGEGAKDGAGHKNACLNENVLLSPLPQLQRLFCVLLLEPRPAIARPRLSKSDTEKPLSLR